MAEITVPVLVDSVKHDEDFPFARCVYYTMEGEEPVEETEWTTGFESIGVPYVLLGSSGLPFAPAADHALFDSAQRIEETVDRIERDGRFLLESNDLWVPNALLFPGGTPEGSARGQVFRLGHELFTRAYQHRHGSLSRERFLALCQGLGGQVQPSPAETTAFAQWTQRQVDAARRSYPKAPDLALGWREDDDLTGGTEEGQS